MIELLRRFREWKAEYQARNEFAIWQENHPIEARILGLVDKENRHALASKNNSRRGQLLEAARDERRSLGLRDEFLNYVFSIHQEFGESLAKNVDVLPSQEELTLLRELNYGFLLRGGYLTPELGKPLVKSRSKM